MKHLLLILAISLSFTKVYSQSIRLAILDFENISGISKYDGLGKAMSSMLISDIEANVSPKRLQLVERAQIQKVLKEQKFQTSGNVNKNTAVQAGKILGVNYLLVGDVYILNDQLIINARLTNTETGDIVFSKKQEGKVVNWLSLKSNIANDLVSNLKLPIVKSNPDNKDVHISENSLILYSKGIQFLDKDEIDSANIVLTELKYSDRNFEYTQNEISELYDKAQNQNQNIVLKQKAYILNLHKRISKNPKEAWEVIENFWNGPLDEKYPYLEYLFLKNTYEVFKSDSLWLKYPVNRHGASTVLGDMILYSISSHAAAASEIATAVYYNEERKKNFPLSEIELVWGPAVAEHQLLIGLVPNPNRDSIYYLFLANAQSAWIDGIGSNNKNQMRKYLNDLMPILDLQYHQYVLSNIYLHFQGATTFLFNPYEVLAKLTVLVGTKEEKNRLKHFFEENQNELIYNQKLINLPEYKDSIYKDLLMKNALAFCDCTFEDLISNKFNSYQETLTRDIANFGWVLLALCLENKYSEANDRLRSIDHEKVFQLSEYNVFQGVSFDKFY